MANIIGFSAGVTGSASNVDRMVKEIMGQTGYDSEFVKLTDVNYSACKGCVWLCAEPEICLLEDELLPYYQKIKEADAIVLGSPVHFATISATMTAFISRLWGFRHVNFAIKNKPFILAVSGFAEEQQHAASDDFQKALKHFQVNVVEVVNFCSTIPPCYKCGRHHQCCIGGAYRKWGTEAHNLKIEQRLFQKWEDCPETMVAIKEAAKKLKYVMQA